MRIAIIGFSGSGKSTLARKLGNFYNIPIVHLDSVNFLENWVERPKEQMHEIVSDFISNNDSWVIDGNYSRVAPQRYEQADLIIYLAYNRFTCLKGVIKRYKTYKNKTRPDMGKGCNEKLDKEFILWVLHNGRTKERKLRNLNIIKNAKKGLIFKNRRQLKKYLKEIGCNQ